MQIHAKPVERQFGDFVASAQKSHALNIFKKMVGSRDPRVKAAVKAANDSLLRCKILTPGAVHTDQVLTNLSIRYASQQFVGLSVLPIITVAKPSGKFYTYSKRDRIGTPDASIGIRSTPNEISETRTLANYATEPFALMDFLDDRLLRMQDAPLDEMGEMVAALNEVHGLLEEIRIAAVCTTAANFGGNTVDLSGTSRWDTTTGTPIEAILAAKDTLWDADGANRTIGVCPPEVYTKLRRHPAVVAAFQYTTSRPVSPGDLAELFGLDEILIARARKDIGNEAQSAVYNRVWGPNFAIIKVNPNPGLRTATFGATFRFGQKITNQWFDPMPGLSGGYYAKVGMEESHQVISPDLGYLFTNVIS